VSRRRKLGYIYAGIGRTLVQKASSLLPLAFTVFVPLGLIDAFSTEISLDSLTFRHGIEVAAVLAATFGAAVTGLLGEVFFSGAVAVSLTHPPDQKPPSTLEVARRLDYKRLILVDLAYVAMVILGSFLLFIPGVLLFVWFGLSGPVVEIEKRTVRDALMRSYRLVRGNFWIVALVLGPIEIVGDALSELIVGAVHSGLGHSFFATWMAEAVSNAILTPIFAVAAVLLTLDLIAATEGRAGGSIAASAPEPAAA
jgi:hypothetical protein